MKVLDLRTFAPASLFTFHAEGPSRMTLAGSPAGVNRAKDDVVAVLTSWRRMRQVGACDKGTR